MSTTKLVLSDLLENYDEEIARMRAGYEHDLLIQYEYIQKLETKLREREEEIARLQVDLAATRADLIYVRKSVDASMDAARTRSRSART